ncbi:Protein F37C4.5-like [Oopsacas minuta]|uniref:Protein F37C4.5-like n=1 Tax=Oopsacas minuta TaxID=111878 RepID=A0AAV7JPZ5_9METZ|nr:Protein F37C4.5-like [Oopsacas minuta]
MATLSDVLKEISVDTPADKKNKERITAATEEREKSKRVKLSECTFSRVVVYQDQAEVRRDLSCCLAEGENTVTIVGFPEVIDPDSVRVELKGGKQKTDVTEGVVQITDVVYNSQYRVEFEEEMTETGGGEIDKVSLSVSMSESDQLKREKVMIERKISVLKRLLNLLSKMNAVLLDEKVRSSEEAMTRVKQASTRDHLSCVVEFVEYSCSRRDELDKRVSSLREQLNSVVTKLETIALNEARSGGRVGEGDREKGVGHEYVRAVEIVFESDRERSVEVLVSYMVTNASWSSLYHLRVSTEDSSVQVQYFGQVKQWTGEDWSNTYLSLSTATPSKGGNPPELQPHHISRYYPQTMQYYSGKQKRFSSLLNAYDPTIEDESLAELQMLSGGQERFRTITSAMPRPMQAVEVSTSQVQTGMFIQTFNVQRPASIPSDSTEHKVSVTVINLESTFENVCLPEMNTNVYLLAKATNTSEYPLISGPTSVFMDNNFICKSKLDSVSPGEEISCSLGIDPLVRVSYKTGDSFQSHQSGWISKGTLSEEYNKVTSVKNTKKKPVSVKIVESVPVSQDDRVKVHLIEPVCDKVGVKVGVSGGSVIMNEKNHLEWHMQVEPTSQRKFLLSYVVEYPVPKYY